jgi:hypothetical protein
MFQDRLAFTVLGLACVAAAGGGAYIATRQNASESVVKTVAAESRPPVQATEAALDRPRSDDPSAPVPFRSPAAKRAPLKNQAASAPVAKAHTDPAPAAPTQDRNAPAAAPAFPADPPHADAQVPSPPHAEEPRPVESLPFPEPPPLPTARELVVSADSVLGLRLESTVSSDTAKVEDRVDARVARDVRVGNDVAIPAGARAIGSVMSVERGGKVKDRARLGIRFHTLVLADGTQVPITSETIYRNGDAPGQGSTAKIGGGAVAGAILGAILGGGKGAAIGGAAGAGAGSAAVAAGDRSNATFQAGADVTARIISPVTITVDK